MTKLSSTGDILTTETTQDDAQVIDPEAMLSPYDKRGGWYVINTYSGHEKKVKITLETRVKSMHLEDKVFEVVIPTEETIEYRMGKKVTVDRKQFPGYVLVRMYMDDDAWYAVENCPSVTGFVAKKSVRPLALSRKEVEGILGVPEETSTKVKNVVEEAPWNAGDSIRVVTGPFADFNGNIESVLLEQEKVKVLVDIFGRETPVEVGFDEIVAN